MNNNNDQIAFHIGLVNILIVFTIGLYIFTDLYKYLPRSLDSVVMYYLKFSFIPALVSVYFPNQTERKLALFNNKLNYTYLVFYVLIYFFAKNYLGYV